MNNRQTIFFLLVDPMDKEHKDPDTIDLEAPRLAQYMLSRKLFGWKLEKSYTRKFLRHLGLLQRFP